MFGYRTEWRLKLRPTKPSSDEYLKLTVARRVENITCSYVADMLLPHPKSKTDNFRLFSKADLLTCSCEKLHRNLYSGTYHRSVHTVHSSKPSQLVYHINQITTSSSITQTFSPFLLLFTFPLTCWRPYTYLRELYETSFIYSTQDDYSYSKT